jgi:hypothetical protein
VQDLPMMDVKNIHVLSVEMLKNPLNCGWHYQVKSVTDSTEPANYTGSYTAVSKQIADAKIAMSQRKL